LTTVVLKKLTVAWPVKKFLTLYKTCHVKWVPSHHGMACPQVANGGNGLKILIVAANIMNKQSQTTDRG
jgi:hypothetical protein